MGSSWHAGVVVPAPVVWSPRTRAHDPKHEVWVGVPTTGTEVSARVDAILDALAGHPTHEAVEHDDTVLERVHDGEFLTFLGELSAAWDSGPYAELVGQDRATPYLFPDPGADLGYPRPSGDRAARAGGGVLLRHDDARRAWHLAGGAARRRLRHHS